jgi:hypothetical protein
MELPLTSDAPYREIILKEYDAHRKEMSESIAETRALAICGRGDRGHLDLLVDPIGGKALGRIDQCSGRIAMLSTLR